MRCLYNSVNFFQNPHNRHGRAMGWLSWVWSLIYVLLLSSQYLRWYREKLDRVITARDCILRLVFAFNGYLLPWVYGISAHNVCSARTQPKPAIYPPCSFRLNKWGANKNDIYNSHQNKHDDIIKWKHFLRYWPYVRGIHRTLVNSPQWRGALMFSLIWSWINGWVNNREAGGLRCHLAHYDVIVMDQLYLTSNTSH